MDHLRRTAKVAALATALAGITLSMGASPASAATTTPQLGFFAGGCEPGRVGLQISGRIDAAAPISRVTLDVWGSDSVWDDHLFGPSIDPQAPLGANYVGRLCLLPSTLDEDVGEDEIYVKVIVTGNGHSFYQQTNTIQHSF
jgi:hypothetical protein